MRTWKKTSLNILSIKSKAQGALLILRKSACQEQKQQNAFKALTEKEVQNAKPISYLNLFPSN